MESYDIEKFLKRKVHLYTLFNYVYFLITNSEGSVTQKLNVYGEFALNYSKEEKLEQTFKDKYSLILEYKSLVLEGTQQRKNRIRRFKIIKELIG